MMTNEEKIRLLQATLDWVLNDLAEWCDAVSVDSSWDCWDRHYKAFYYGNPDDPSGLEKARAALEQTH